MTPKGSLGAPLFGCAVLIALSAAALAGRLPTTVPAWYATASLIAFTAYALDKSAAQSGRWRIRERTLHLFALLGGWPGALAAQGMLRHKSRKQPFRAIFWATVGLNCGALLAYAFPAALAALLSVGR